MKWLTALADGVKAALAVEGQTRLAVHSERQAQTGQNAVLYLNRRRVDDVEFVVVSKRDHPVGAILSPAQ